ncbi:MAG TPA: hypothetical protein VKZ41_09650 [Gemmatimonadales bacterium]|nr:hypothetical protein [Gemmatimonadales bacterium]
MLDDLNSRKGGEDLSGESWVPGAERGSDREVPLSTKAQAAVHRWLDGESPEDDAVLADTKHVEMWRRVNAETSRRRQMMTPAYVETRIMQSLPAGVPTVEANTATNRGVEVKLSPGVAIAAAIGFLALGAILGALFAAL